MSIVLRLAAFAVFVMVCLCVVCCLVSFCVLCVACRSVLLCVALCRAGGAVVLVMCVCAVLSVACSFKLLASHVSTSFACQKAGAWSVYNKNMLKMVLCMLV